MFLPAASDSYPQYEDHGKAVGPRGHNDDLANAQQTAAQGIPGRETLDASEYCSDSHFMHAEQEQTKLTADYFCCISNKSRHRISPTIVHCSVQDQIPGWML